MIKLLSLILLVACFGIQSGASQGVYGIWKFPEVSSGGLTFNVTISFSKDTISIKNVCSVADRSLEAKVTVPANYTESTVTILGHAEDKESKDGFNCNIDIKEGSVDYAVSSDDSTLTLTKAGEGSYSLSRVNN